MSSDLKTYLAQRCALVDEQLQQSLPAAEVAPSTLHQAMRHSLFAGGKRLRPILCLAAAEACGGSLEDAAPLACAVECLHTYSLIHDDLPAMDDDDFRRGVPTCHKVYGEAIAILAGDAMQALAFELIARAKPSARHGHAAMLRELAVTAGSLHLVAGQVADLEGEGKALDLAALQFIHHNKTAALLCTSLRLGGMSANASPEQMQALQDFGMATGLAFQVIDDILDCTQSSEKLGKSAGKDEASGKSTYPALMGLEASREVARELTAKAHQALAVFNGNDARLGELADHLLGRDF